MLTSRQRTARAKALAPRRWLRGRMVHCSAFNPTGKRACSWRILTSTHPPDYSPRVAGRRRCRSYNAATISSFSQSRRHDHLTHLDIGSILNDSQSSDIHYDSEQFKARPGMAVRWHQQGRCSHDSKFSRVEKRRPTASRVGVVCAAPRE